jgi:hypothetical protein
MKRRIFIIIIVALFNFLLIKGVDYSNKFIQENDLMIYFNGRDTDKESTLPSEPKPIIVNEWNGEKKDAIASKLEKYYKDTYLEGYGEKITASAINRNVDPYLIASIIYVNSKCSVECQPFVRMCNNAGGTSGNPSCLGGRYKKYKTIDESFDDLVIYIKDNFVSKDISNPYEMYKKYGKDAAWAYSVNKYYGMIKKG